jgi:hypothetical protein
VLDYLANAGLATGLILLALLGWIRVQQAARDYAARHPEFGPAKEEGSGCGGCGAGGCHGDGQCAAPPRITLDHTLQERDR